MYVFMCGIHVRMFVHVCMIQIHVSHIYTHVHTSIWNIIIHENIIIHVEYRDRHLSINL